jgi:hypothetical protein
MTTTCDIAYPTRSRRTYEVWVPLDDYYMGSQCGIVLEYFEGRDGDLVGGDGRSIGSVWIGPVDDDGWTPWRVEMTDGRVASGRAVSFDTALALASKRYCRMAGDPVARAR